MKATSSDQRARAPKTTNVFFLIFLFFPTHDEPRANRPARNATRPGTARTPGRQSLRPRETTLIGRSMHWHDESQRSHALLDWQQLFDQDIFPTATAVSCLLGLFRRVTRGKAKAPPRAKIPAKASAWLVAPLRHTATPMRGRWQYGRRLSQTISSQSPSGDSMNFTRATSPSQQSSTTENCKSNAPRSGPNIPQARSTARPARNRAREHG